MASVTALTLPTAGVNTAAFVYTAPILGLASRHLEQELLMVNAKLIAGLSVLVLAGCAAEQPVAMNDLPPAVRATLEKETAGGKITEIEKERKDGKTVYSADATIDGKYWDIAVAEDGKLISKELEKK